MESVLIYIEGIGLGVSIYTLLLTTALYQPFASETRRYLAELDRDQLLDEITRKSKTLTTLYITGRIRRRLSNLLMYSYAVMFVIITVTSILLIFK